MKRSLYQRIRRPLYNWLDCRLKRCSYFEHYLAYGPAELTHLGYHAAERHCERAQLRLQEWFDQNMNNQRPVPEHLQRQATAWEVRVRA